VVVVVVFTQVIQALQAQVVQEAEVLVVKVLLRFMEHQALKIQVVVVVVAVIGQVQAVAESLSSHTLAHKYLTVV
jgi:hypothetical protein